MKKIYIGMSAPTGSFEPFAWIIKKVEARPYDHVFIRLQEPMNGEYIYFQASKEMVNVYNKDIWLTQNAPCKEYEIDISDEKYAQLWQFVIQNLGVPYSLLQDFGILLMKVFNLSNNPFNAGMTSGEFCSELGAYVCTLLGINIEQEPSSIDPSRLDAILAAQNLPCKNF